MYLITERDVYEISCKEIGEDFGRIGQKFRVTIKDEDGEIVRRIDVGFTGSLLASTPISEQDKCNYAMKKAARVFKIGSNAPETNISTGNLERLRGKKADVDITYGELSDLIRRFFTKHPDPTLHELSPTDLFISSDLDFRKIVNSLAYFKTRGIVEATSDNEDEYILAPGGLDKLDTLKLPAEAVIPMANRYFQLVQLPKNVKEPFVYVLMPFGDQEIDQKVYHDVIKPTMEEELGTRCVRSDEVTDPGVINNQIFTLIRKAMFVVAETTCKNPNVFYEIGMAHAFDKDVFLFAERRSAPLPFDITTHRAVFYDDLDDLKQKIVENLKHHISWVFHVKHHADLRREI